MTNSPAVSSSTEPWWKNPSRVRHLIAGAFEGGGAKGVVYTGALQELLAQKCWFGAVAGSSTGAIAAALVAAGLDPDEFGREIRTGMATLATTPSTGLNRLRRTGGYFARDRLFRWLDDLLTARVAELLNERINPVTFRDLFRATGIELNVVAADISLRRQIVFSHLDTPHCQVTDAVVASSSVPFVFSSGAMTAAKPGTPKAQYFHTIVDGGVWANFPLFVFTDRTFRTATGRRPKPEQPIVIGFLLDERRAEDEPSFTNIRFVLEGTQNLTAWERRPRARRPGGSGALATSAALVVRALSWPVRLVGRSSGLRRGRWPPHRHPLVRAFIDGLDGTLGAIYQVAIGLVVLLGLSYGALKTIAWLWGGVSSVSSWFANLNLPVYLIFAGLSVLWAVAAVIVVALAYSILLVLIGVALNWLLLLTLRRTTYGLLGTYIAASGAPTWTAKRDDVIALPIPPDVSALDFVMDSATAGGLIERARDKTKERLRDILRNRSRS